MRHHYFRKRNAIIEVYSLWMAVGDGEVGQRFLNVNGPSVRQLLISTRTEVASSQLSDERNKTLANNGENKWVPVLGPLVQPVTFERALMENLHLSPFQFTSVK